ncbi:MAG TPA: L,D-transpeptidase family protein [Acidimicrobiia bacterium]|nr:L,D-transpeptidase family protein [Acidimicrobiia bacterium]
MVQKAFPAQVIVGLLLAFLVISGVVAAGAVLRDDATEAPAAEAPVTTAPTVATTTTSTLPPTTVPTLPQLVQPSVVALPDLPLYPVLGPGSPAELVGPYEQRLADLRFDPGAIDGVYDQATTYAVHALQKIAGTDRNGRISVAEKAALETFQYPLPLHPDAEANRTEIDVAKQVLTLYENYQVRLVTTTSTASGENYCYNTPKAAPTRRVCEVATTPSGRYTYYFYYSGWHKGDLGALYNPFYFNKGIAVHGYQEIPPYPASHGCSRVPMHIGEYFHTLVTQDAPVYVDGGQPAQILSSTPI